MRRYRSGFSLVTRRAAIKPTVSGYSLLGSLFVSLVMIHPAQAQITADNTLPITSLVPPGCVVCLISGGTPSGTNLFHSFREFSVSIGGEAWFNNSPTIQNVLVRVTGNTASSINGRLRTNGTANLFLINPQGIVLGPNAQLSLGGSFVATTANAIQFGSQGNFSASNPNDPSLLTINPSALLYNQNTPSAIQVNSARLAVPSGRSLMLIGGTVDVNAASLGTTMGGHIEISGLAGSGTIDLTTNGNLLTLGSPQDLTRSNILIRNMTSVDVSSGGSIAIKAKDLEISGKSFLSATSSSNLPSATSQPATITLDVTGMTNIVEGGVYSQVTSQTTGKGGNIQITTGSLLITSGGLLSTSTFGQGDAGNITIQAADAVSINGVSSSNNGIPNSNISTIVNDNAIGQGGNVEIRTRSLDVSNGGQVQVDTRGQGNAGNITIQASDSVSFSGVGSNSFPNGPFNTVIYPDGVRRIGSSGAFSSVSSGATGQGGDIIISARTLSVTNRATLYVDSYGQGNGGNISITANSGITLASGGSISALGSGTIALQAPGLAFSSRDDRIFALPGLTPSLPQKPLLVIDPPSNVSFSPSTDFVDASEQIEHSCAPKGDTNQTSSFNITGRGGIPLGPYDPLRDVAVVDHWVMLGNSSDDIEEHLSMQAATTVESFAPPAQTQIVEAQGWLIGRDGSVYLVAQAPNVMPHVNWQVPVDCGL